MSKNNENERLRFFEKFLKEKIPLSKAMQISLINLNEDRVEIFCPLEPNRNHMETAFGGSLGAALLLSCYAWLFNVLKIRGIDSHIVVKESLIKYISPVDGDFMVICQAPRKEDYERFFTVLSKKQRAKLPLKAEIIIHKKTACIMVAEFVALAETRT